MSPDASWNFAPGILIGLAVYVGVYVWRWRDCRVGSEPHPPSRWRLASFLLGVTALFAALVSPIDILGEQIISMHMVQHVLLLDIAPVLIILGFTKVLLRPATRRIHWVERRVGFIASPLFAILFYTLAMWFWHVPALYDAAAENSTVHLAEHLTFGTAGFLYWWHLLSPVSTRLRREGMTPIVYMASTKATVGLLGIAMTFAPVAVYDYYKEQPEYWGLSPLSDQAMAGAIMAIEQALVMGIAIAYLFMRMLDESEKRDQREERYGTPEERAAKVQAAPGPHPGVIEVPKGQPAPARPGEGPAA
ncbi:cytochrome c oxidase assembly protein [Conexibacter arvalis]|uniref:Cytochrome c oxidase assembly factor CtaG n=1 Tax=Conexibacter arvalis TaxID=912552 RepID=A0A840IK79_9ACTN|nr:cytochrome c oxidase assembly protein [Conexibacter arvalis]MBB4664424.1 cytochrome c oxidase assembly factor CtaG [Conexibacter arvalis]